MSDEKALLAAIWEYPHEDTPRLVYADWLEENGRPERAEFIRAQIAAARLPLADPAQALAARRSRELLTRYHTEWIAPFIEVFGGYETHVPDHRTPGDRGDHLPVTFRPVAGSFPSPQLPIVMFRRGFPDSVSAVMLRSLLADRTEFPGPRPKVFMNTTQDDPGPTLTELGEVLSVGRFSGWIYSTNEPGYRALLARPGLLPALVSLSLYRLPVPAPGLPDLLARLGRLEVLCFGYSDWGPELVELVMAGGTHRQLKGFMVSEAANLTIPAALRAMGRDRWPLLEQLRLGTWHGPEPQPGSPQIAPAVPPGAFPRLQEFRLLGTQLPEEELTAVLECPALAHVPAVYYHEMSGVRGMFPELVRKWAGRLFVV
ncbi:MAG TPA: TIGR02996 domain-containing protein [Gemmataceae bacterium]|nr:TIGR02996 domain-containing protein [Gemmataceae bacterium]